MFPAALPTLKAVCLPLSMHTFSTKRPLSPLLWPLNPTVKCTEPSVNMKPGSPCSRPVCYSESTALPGASLETCKAPLRGSAPPHLAGCFPSPKPAQLSSVQASSGTFIKQTLCAGYHAKSWKVTKQGYRHRAECQYSTSQVRTPVGTEAQQGCRAQEPRCTLEWKADSDLQPVGSAG